MGQIRLKTTQGCASMLSFLCIFWKPAAGHTPQIPIYFPQPSKVSLLGLFAVVPYKI